MQGRHKGSQPPAENSTKQTPVFLTREAMATRWSVSVRTIDRRRLDVTLPWTDLNAGHSRKPIVRFLLKGIEESHGKVSLKLHDLAGVRCRIIFGDTLAPCYCSVSMREDHYG